MYTQIINLLLYLQEVKLSTIMSRLVHVWGLKDIRIAEFRFLKLDALISFFDNNHLC